jgi:hypothetical protein
MPVLTAMGERKAGGVGKSRRRSVHHFGNECQRLNGAGTKCLASARDRRNHAARHRQRR